jgi:hypothetical protein
VILTRLLLRRRFLWRRFLWRRFLWRRLLRWWLLWRRFLRHGRHTEVSLCVSAYLDASVPAVFTGSDQIHLFLIIAGSEANLLNTRRNSFSAAIQTIIIPVSNGRKRPENKQKAQ